MELRLNMAAVASVALAASLLGGCASAHADRHTESAVGVAYNLRHHA